MHCPVLVVMGPNQKLEDMMNPLVGTQEGQFDCYATEARYSLKILTCRREGGATLVTKQSCPANELVFFWENPAALVDDCGVAWEKDDEDGRYEKCIVETRDTSLRCLSQEYVESLPEGSTLQVVDVHV